MPNTILQQTDYDILGIAIVSVFAIFILKLILHAFANAYIRIHREDLQAVDPELVGENQERAKWLIGNLSEFEDKAEQLGLYETVHCSSSVVANAQRNSMKYLMKYSNISYAMDCLQYVDFCDAYLREWEQLTENMDHLREEIMGGLPLFVRIYHNKKERIPYTVCDVSRSMMEIPAPVFTFQYTSPAQKSAKSFAIICSADVMHGVLLEMNARLSKTEHSKAQRSAMTNDLREAIKQRDHYTCCMCGNSVINEPNLLLEVDHIVPVSKGGKTEASNLQTLCWRCNRKKADK